MKCKTFFENIDGIDNLERLKNQPKKFAKMISHKMPMRNLPISPKLIDEIFINRLRSILATLPYPRA
ncbi:unnamed protein product [Meloidogyne enterolobii]|uniref:Uncharacterized protein n=1 Tax=Meloidogyne enterolobii TaxID=390850 RepID=A0ACB0Y852_MELEN